MREDQRNYIVVGVFVIAMLAGFLAWLALLSGRTGATDPYYIRYGSVVGLSQGTQIYYDGFPIGLIESIDRVDDGDEQIFRLDVSIKRGWKIPVDSVAEIGAASGLLSAMAIHIRGGQATTHLQPGSRIPSVEASNLLAKLNETASVFSEFLLETLKPKLEDIVADLNQTMTQVNTLLSPTNTGRVASILETLETVSQEVEAVTGGLGETRREVDRVLGQVGQLIETNEDDFSQSIVELRESLEAVARHMDAIAINLEETMRNTSEFSQQIRENPGVLLRGRSAEEEPDGSR